MTNDRDGLMRDAMTEALAMTVFVFFGTGSVLATGQLLAQQSVDSFTVPRILPVAFAFGMTILTLAYTLGPISGGHINPAVTLSLLLAGAVSPLRAAAYVAAQLMGAATGSLLLWGATSGMSYNADGSLNEIVGSPPYELGANSLNPTLTPGNGFALEMMGTLLLCLTVLMTVVHPSSTAGGPPALAPLPIGMAVFIAHVVLVPFTGCGINPARSFGPAFVNAAAGSSVWGTAHWIYWLGPAAGASLAAGIFRLLLSPPSEPSAAVTAHQPTAKPRGSFVSSASSAMDSEANLAEVNLTDV